MAVVQHTYTQPQVVRQTTTMPGGSWTLQRVISTVLNIIEGLLGLRFLFRLLGANPTNAIVDLLYTITTPLMAPFQGIFPQLVNDSFILEWSTLIAMAVWALIAWALIGLIDSATPRRVEVIEEEKRVT